MVLLPTPHSISVTWKWHKIQTCLVLLLLLSWLFVVETSNCGKTWINCRIWRGNSDWYQVKKINSFFNTLNITLNARFSKIEGPFESQETFSTDFKLFTHAYYELIFHPRKFGEAREHICQDINAQTWHVFFKL